MKTKMMKLLYPISSSGDELNRWGKGRSFENDRIEWLRSQLIGRDLKIDTPFGDRILTYADHTASGRSLEFIENYITQRVLPLYGNTHTNDSFVGEKMTKMVCEAREYIKRCLGAGPSDSLIFCGSGTTAAIKRLQEVMGIAVPATMRSKLVESLREEERWVVFVGPYEHHSNLLSWRESTAEVVQIGVDADGMFDLGALEDEIASIKYRNRPMLGSFSACSNITGNICDTRAIARLLHDRGAFACFDFAASGPYVEIDMRSGELEGYDAIFLSPHKFIGGPGTPGILLMNKALYLLGSSPPSTCGGGVVDYVNGFNSEDTLYSNEIEERENAGTPPIIQKIRTALTFWVKEFVGSAAIEIRERNYNTKTIEQLHRNPGIQILGNVRSKKLSIVSFLVNPGANSASSKESNKPLHGRFVAKLLNDLFGIQARGGCACAGPYAHFLLGVDQSLSLCIRSHVQKGYSGLKPGWTRVSFPYFMSEVEFNFILQAIDFVASFGDRFLSLYYLDWATGDWSFINGRDSKFQPPQKSRGLGGGLKCFKRSKHSCLKSYIEDAKAVASCLPEDHPPMSIPHDVPPSSVLFRL